MTAVLRGNALAIPLADSSVDLIITSPPYFSQRSYRDDGAHYDGQLGSEPTPQEFLEALWAATAECWRVLKPGGSMFVNLGDKRSGSGAPGTTSGLSTSGSTLDGTRAHSRTMTQGERTGIRGSYTRAAFGRPKSKMLLPHRYAIGCEDGLADPERIGWIVRQDGVWNKPNGLPESVTDRQRDTHEYWFHLTKMGDYFAALDEIREPHTGNAHPGRKDGKPPPGGKMERQIANGDHSGNYRGTNPDWFDPRGRMPSSVWTIATEALYVPDYFVEGHGVSWRMMDAADLWRLAEMRYRQGDMTPLMVRELDHFAAFPQEWPRRFILGFSPSGICTHCGEGRRPITEKTHDVDHVQESKRGRMDSAEPDGNERGINATSGRVVSSTVARILGYGCSCTTKPRRDMVPEPAVMPATRPAVVLDPFGGTGTTAMVARALGRVGISLDLSLDYCRLARWRIFESGHGAKSRKRTNQEAQGALL